MKVIFLIFTVGLSFAQAQKNSSLKSLMQEGESTSDKRRSCDLFVKAATLYPTDARAQFMAGKSLIINNRSHKAIPHLLRAFRLNPDVDVSLPSWLGIGFQANGKFDSAIVFYTMVKSRAIGEPFEKSKELAHWAETKIIESNNAKIYKSIPVDVTIVEVASVNSEFADYAPVVTNNDTLMIFTSRRPVGQKGNVIAEDGFYNERIFESKKRDGAWQAPIELKIGDRYKNNSVASISPDGSFLFLYSESNSGDIKTCERVQGVYSKCATIRGGVNSEWRETSASLTSDAKKLFFSSDRPDGAGGLDIYVATLSRDGGWNSVRNIGTAINTNLDEEGVYVSPDGLQLFFCSDGHAGMGGFDIFRSTYNPATDEWSAPVNLGYPINGPLDDVFFSMSENGKKAYFSTANKTDDSGIDIYEIDMTEWKEIPLKARSRN